VIEIKVCGDNVEAIKKSLLELAKLCAPLVESGGTQLEFNFAKEKTVAPVSESFAKEPTPPYAAQEITTPETTVVADTGVKRGRGRPPKAVQAPFVPSPAPSPAPLTPATVAPIAAFKAEPEEKSQEKVAGECI